MDWIQIVACIFLIVWGGLHLVDGFRNKKYRGMLKQGPLKLIMGPGPYYENILNFFWGSVMVFIGVTFLLKLMKII
jgi:hypothetical protein